MQWDREHFGHAREDAVAVIKKSFRCSADRTTIELLRSTAERNFTLTAS
jgi:hypothetical protein